MTVSPQAIGIDVGGTKALALLVDREGNVLHEVRTPAPHDTDQGPGVALAHVLAAQIDEICAATGLNPQTTPVGIGLPGLVTRDGTLAYAPNLDSASGANLPKLLHDIAGVQSVSMENDGNAAAVAEHAWGAGRGASEFAAITLGTGIGGGIIANGELIRGRSGFGGEVGHMIVRAGGIQCACGRQGCWERYASGTGLGALTVDAAREGRLPTLLAQHGAPENVRAEHVTQAAAEGLEEAKEVLREVAWWLAVGLSNLVEIFDIGHFVIGGGLSTAAGELLPVATKDLVSLVMAADKYPAFTLEPAVLGARAGALGAALVGMSRGA